MDYGSFDHGAHHPNLQLQFRRATGRGTWNGIKLASRWRRLFAWGLDAFLVVAVYGAFGGSGLVAELAGVVFYGLNNMLLQSWRGQSIGKMAARIHLILPYKWGNLPAHREIGPDRAGVRSIAQALSLLFWFLVIPFWLISSKRQTPADALTGTICLRSVDMEKVMLAQVFD